jgi:hypothetical protein
MHQEFRAFYNYVVASTTTTAKYLTPANTPNITPTKFYTPKTVEVKPIDFLQKKSILVGDKNSALTFHISTTTSDKTTFTKTFISKTNSLERFHHELPPKQLSKREFLNKKYLLIQKDTLKEEYRTNFTVSKSSDFEKIKLFDINTPLTQRIEEIGAIPAATQATANDMLAAAALHDPNIIGMHGPHIDSPKEIFLNTKELFQEILNNSETLSEIIKGFKNPEM